ncbi:conjugative transfer system coupling protein TraD [Photobacterium phosphoreum]|uniref:conjugative transfer system coupling protein TraD n=1 Tax=Photobacterium phosphoreum TaxID=659 RepID=UPI0015E6C77C|nr:conjugative transfer system coupling protein TraD [Photobacterium phosphoreum]
MSVEYHMDGRLRPVTEYKASTVSALSSTLLAAIPSLSGLPVSMSYTLAVATAAMSAAQFLNGRKLRRYQKNLVRLEAYAMTTEELPVSNTEFWLGKGFDWTQIHTQRTFECQRQGGQKYIRQSALYYKARNLERYAQKNHNLKLITSITHSQHLISGKKFGKKLEKIASKSPSLKPLAMLSRKIQLINLLRNPVAPLPPVGGSPYLHGVGADEETDIFMELSGRNGHTLVLGTTRVGKTRAAELFISADIARTVTRKITYRGFDGSLVKKTITEPEAMVAVFDPKGDADLLARCYSEAIRHGREFILFHLGAPDITSRYNGIGHFSQISECATRSTNPLGGGSDSAFKDFAWRFSNIICTALCRLRQRPSYELIKKYIMDMEVLYIEYCKMLMVELQIENWQELHEELVQNLKGIPAALKALSRESIAFYMLIKEQLDSGSMQVDPVYENLLNSVRYDQAYFSKITASYLPLLEKLCSGDNLKILSPAYDNTEDPRPVFDWTQAARKKAVVYLGFDAMTNRDVASAASNAMLSDLLSLSGKIYKSGVNYGIDGADSTEKPIMYLHLDEANEMVGDEFIPILNKAGGAGIRVTAYTQSRQDLTVKLGDRAKAEVLESNFNTVIMFRVKTEDTANLLIDQLPEVDVYDISVQNGVTPDSSFIDEGLSTKVFSTRVSDGVAPTKTQKLITADQIISLPKGQAFALIEGSRVVKLRFPLPKESKNTLPPDIDSLCRAMKTKYQSYDGWWNEPTSKLNVA